MSRFYRPSSESSDSSSESSGDEAVAARPLAATAKPAFAMSDSDEETSKRVVKTAKVKRYDELRDLIKQMKNSKKIKDMHKVLSVFEDLCRAYEKARPVVMKEDSGVMPRFYARNLVELEDFINEAWEDRDGRKNMSKNNAKGLTTLRQKLKKYIRDSCEAEVNSYREKPDAEGYSSEEAEESLGESDDEAPSAGKAAAPAAKAKKPKVVRDESDEESPSWESSTESESDLDEYEGMAMETLRQKFLKKAPGEKDESKQTAKDKRGKAREETRKKKQKDYAEEGEGQGPDWITIERGVATYAEQKIEMFPKDTEITHELVIKKLNEILSLRGKKRQDRRELVDSLNELLAISNANNLGPGMAVKIEITVIAGLFDYNVKISDCMNSATWEQALNHIRHVLTIVQEHNIFLSEHVGEEDEILKDPSPNYQVRGCVLALFEKLDDEFTKMLQETDCHSTDYVDRLKGENPLCAFIQEMEDHLIKSKASRSELCRIYMKKIEHLYYKFDYNAIAKEDNEDLATLATQPDRETSQSLIDRLCKYIYTNDDTKRLRTRAMLCQIYHHALHDRWHSARDLMLMSHLQGNIDSSDVQTQILHNRVVCQLGLCAFRHGLIREAHSALTDIQSGGKAKELLAQGLPLRQQQDRTPEQEKLEKQRQVPYHMHINLELLECVYLICSMLLEIPLMASKEFELRRARISRSFHYQLKQSERQSLTGPPENTREHVVAAAKALLVGDWRACRDFVVNDKMNAKVWNLFHRADKVSSMLVRRIQEESLRTYMFTYSSVYDSISIRNLAEMFELDMKPVYGIISKMIINEELSASLDEPAECVVMHRVEPTRIQTLALQLTEKLTTLAENNEQIMDPRSSQAYTYRPNWQQQRQPQQQDYRERGGRQGQQQKTY